MTIPLIIILKVVSLDVSARLMNEFLTADMTAGSGCMKSTNHRPI